MYLLSSLTFLMNDSLSKLLCFGSLEATLLPLHVTHSDTEVWGGGTPGGPQAGRGQHGLHSQGGVREVAWEGRGGEGRGGEGRGRIDQ